MYINERLTLTKAMKVFSFFFFCGIVNSNDNDKKEMTEKRLHASSLFKQNTKSFISVLINS